MSDYDDYQICDCCDGLHEVVHYAGGHMQCEPCTNNARLTAELEQAQGRIEQLESALRKYGQHLPECTDEPLFCDCGLVGAINGVLSAGIRRHE